MNNTEDTGLELLGGFCLICLTIWLPFSYGGRELISNLINFLI